MEVAVVLDDLSRSPVPTALVVVAGPVFQEFDVGLQVGGVVGVDGMVADQLDERSRRVRAMRTSLFSSPLADVLASRYSSDTTLKSGLSEGGRATVRLSSL